MSSRAQNILAGNFYWYDNNWHYIRKWDHLKNSSSLSPLNDPQQQALKRLQSQDLSESDCHYEPLASLIDQFALDPGPGQRERRENDERDQEIDCMCHRQLK
jgi:hypothetical protein